MIFGADHGSIAVHHVGLPAARVDIAVLELHDPLPMLLPARDVTWKGRLLSGKGPRLSSSGCRLGSGSRGVRCQERGACCSRVV